MSFKSVLNLSEHVSYINSREFKDIVMRVEGVSHMGDRSIVIFKNNI